MLPVPSPLRRTEIEQECRRAWQSAEDKFINPTHPHLAANTHSCDWVASRWEAWSGDTPWSRLMRQARQIPGVRCVDFGGVPRSSSAIPLTFVLVDRDGRSLTKNYRLRDLREFVASHG